MVRTPDLCKGKTEAHFQAVGKVEEVMEEFIIEQRGSQMTERASIRAEEGILSIPVAHLRLRVARLSFTKSGVVVERLRI